MIDPHLVEKESFTNIPNLRLFSSKIVYQIGIIKIYLIYFPQSAYSFRIITKLGYQPGFFNIKTIIRHAVAAHIEGGSYTTDIRFERYAFSDDSQKLLEFSPCRNVHSGILRNIRLNTNYCFTYTTRGTLFFKQNSSMDSPCGMASAL